MATIPDFANALLLALGSSTDNFTVGLALGIKNKHVSMKFNLIISFANAIGAYVAALVGYLAMEVLSTNVEVVSQYASLFAGLAFYYLAIREVSGNSNDESQQVSMSARSNTFKEIIGVAIPMSLNNLASGIAGGAVGISPSSSFVMAFVCSYGMMDAGYRIAKFCSFQWIARYSNFITFFIFGLLGYYQILDYLAMDTE